MQYFKPTHTKRGFSQSEITSFDQRGAPVAQSVEQWICDWNVAGSNPRLECPCGTISIVSAPCTYPVFWTRHKIEAPSESQNGAGAYYKKYSETWKRKPLETKTANVLDQFFISSVETTWTWRQPVHEDHSVLDPRMVFVSLYFHLHVCTSCSIKLSTILCQYVLFWCRYNATNVSEEVPSKSP